MSHSLRGLPGWQFSTTISLEPAGAGHAARAAGASVSQPAANPIATTAHTSHCRAPVRISATSRPDSMNGQRSGVLAARTGGGKSPHNGWAPLQARSRRHGLARAPKPAAASARSQLPKAIASVFRVGHSGCLARACV